MCATSTAATCGRRRRCRSAIEQAPYIVAARPGLQPVRASRPTASRSSCCSTCRLADPIKISRLTIRNISGRPRRLSVTAYVEWVLGLSRGASAPTVVTELDAATGAIFARNPWNMHHGARVAFADLGGRQTGMDRRSQRIHRPQRHHRQSRGAERRHPAVAAGRRRPRSCAALQTTIELERGGDDRDRLLPRPGRRRRRGAGPDRALPRRRSRRRPSRGHGAIWDETLGAVQVKTPDRAMDILLNGWLLYQTLACRFWARSAFYQASGAYGFRDQLQDVMSLTVAQARAGARAHPARRGAAVRRRRRPALVVPAGRPGRAHAHLRRPGVARHGRGALRRDDGRCGDPRRNRAVPRRAGAASRASTISTSSPSQADETATLFEHCARGLDLSLATGAHGLPLMGTGDWNDGMNRVGEAGKGESVWLGWFLHAALTRLRSRSPRRATRRRAPSAWTAHAEALRASARPRRLGRRLVSPRLLRRRHAARLGEQRGMPHRFHRPVLGGDFRRRRPGARGPGDGGARPPPGASRRPAGAAVHAAVRQDRARSRLHQGLSARHPREWRPVHPCRRLVDHGLRRARPGRQGGRAVRAAQSRSITPRTRAGVLRYKVEPYVVAADVYSVAPHVGRGGWTWYTGSAGWLYRAGIEAILGLAIKGDVAA